ncbi:MAG: hypothetical protein ABI472_23470 [Ginsengibacter sp.]
MSLTKKNTGGRVTLKRVKNKTVIVTKSKTSGDSPFSKKIKKMNRLLEKAKLLS